MHTGVRQAFWEYYFIGFLGPTALAPGTMERASSAITLRANAHSSVAKADWREASPRPSKDQSCATVPAKAVSGRKSACFSTSINTQISEMFGKMVLAAPQEAVCAHSVPQYLFRTTEACVHVCQMVSSNVFIPDGPQCLQTGSNPVFLYRMENKLCVCS